MGLTPAGASARELDDRPCAAWSRRRRWRTLVAAMVGAQPKCRRARAEPDLLACHWPFPPAIRRSSTVDAAPNPIKPTTFYLRPTNKVHLMLLPSRFPLWAEAQAHKPQSLKYFPPSPLSLSNWSTPPVKGIFLENIVFPIR